jgi:hypothetical protein
MNTNYVYQSAQVGEFRQALLYAAGPSSYSQATGDPVYNPGSNEYINFPMQAVTVSGNYSVEFNPTAAGLNIVRAGAPSPGQSGWTARWFLQNINGGASVVKITAGTGSGMTPGTYPLTFTSGGGSGAAGTVTVTATAMTSYVITNLGSGYTSAPTISYTPGGTPAALTAVLSTAAQEIPTGANLSGETLQFGAFVSGL